MTPPRRPMTNEERHARDLMELQRCAVPQTRPIDRCERGQYETGRASFDATDPVPQGAAWEVGPYQADQDGDGLIFAMPGSVMFLNAVFSTAVVAPVFLLLFDVNTDAIGQGLISPGAIARYTFGPAFPLVTDDTSSGATITYEATAEDVYDTRQRDPRDQRDLVRRAISKGLPFNFGVAAVASFAPRIYTASELAPMEWALTARFQA